MAENLRTITGGSQEYSLMKNVMEFSSYKEEARSAEATATKNVEQFRFEASEAFATFDKRQRKWAKELTGGQFSAVDFYEKYLKEFKPLVSNLTAQPTNATFIKDLKKHLQTDDSTAVETINELILQRKQQAIRHFLAPITPRSAQRAEQLLELPLIELDKLYESFKAYSAYSHVARTLSIPVFDVHASLIRRVILRRRIERERRKREKIETQHLRHLAQELQEFEKTDGDIAGLLAAKNLDLVLILAARNNYEKTAKKPSSNTTKNKIEAMRLFEDTVSKLVERHISAFIENRNITSLQEIHHEEADLKTLLLRIFELDTVAKNRLVVTASDYKKMYDETQQILAAQAERTMYVVKES
jgi:hypothetical protein